MSWPPVSESQETRSSSIGDNPRQGKWELQHVSLNPLHQEMTVAGPHYLPVVLLGTFLAGGSFSKVYRASWNERMVAVKVIPHKIDMLEVTRREVEIIMSLDHPNIVSALICMLWKRTEDPRRSFDDDLDAQTWIVQEFCEGGSLSDFVHVLGGLRDANGSINFPRIVALLVDVARGMQELHQHNIIHGDLKCGNVLLVYRELFLSAKVADFGLSRILYDATHINTKTLGTVSCMSPEMLSDGTMSLKADVYGFGMIMYEMITGRKPYDGHTCSMVINRVLHEGRTPPVPADLPPKYSRLMRLCWSRNPRDRPSFEQIMMLLTGEIQRRSSKMGHLKFQFMKAKRNVNLPLS